MSPCEEGVADQQADPLVLCDDGKRDWLCDIECEIRGKKEFVWTPKAYAHSTDESAGDAWEDGDKRALLGKRPEARQSRLMCTKTSYRSRVVAITPTTRKSRRTMMNASLTASKKCTNTQRTTAWVWLQRMVRRTRGEQRSYQKAAKEEGEYGRIVLCLCKRGRTWD